MQALESIGFVLGTTYRKVSQSLAYHLKEHDITPEQWSVLYYVCAQEGMNQKELASHVFKDQPTTARILDVLHRKNLIRKEMDPQDRRAFLVYPLPAGRELMEKIYAIEQKHNQDLTNLLTPEQFKELHHLLHLLRNKLEPHAEDTPEVPRHKN